MFYHICSTESDWQYQHRELHDLLFNSQSPQLRIEENDPETVGASDPLTEIESSHPSTGSQNIYDTMQQNLSNPF